MSVWSKIRGTFETLFQIGKGGPQLKSTGGVIEHRDSADAAYAIARGATPVGANDLATKSYVDALAGGAFGTAIVDFGASPGVPDVTLAITGQTAIVSGSHVQAWVYPIATADHSFDEHRVEQVDMLADTIVAGTGFTIFGRTRNTLIYGKWTVAWMWH